MAKLKKIYWYPDLKPDNQGKMHAKVHLLEGYNSASINDFKRMADELRETFPQATDDKISGGRVFRSRKYNGFTIVTWDAYIPKSEYPGWEQLDNGRIDYAW